MKLLNSEISYTSLKRVNGYLHFYINPQYYATTTTTEFLLSTDSIRLLVLGNIIGWTLRNHHDHNLTRKYLILLLVNNGINNSKSTSNFNNVLK